jgi:hypothetical protein
MAIAGLVLLFLLSQARPAEVPRATARPAVGVDAKRAILDAFRSHRVVAIGDAHGDLQGVAFQLALIRDPRFAAGVNDILMETGNSRYQDVVDRFVGGEEVPQGALQRVWLDTTQQQAALLQTPALLTAVRNLNTSLPRNRRLRVLVGEPPIDWESMKTADDLNKWEAEPTSSSDAVAASIIRKEVLAKNRRVLVLYGAGHFFRKVVKQSLVTLLEAGGTRAFTVWTNAAAEMSGMQPTVASWPVPSLAQLRGTVLGRVGLSEYLGPNAGEVPPQWLAPMEDQFDAVLYLGPLSTITLARPPLWPCSEPALPERVRRISLMRPALAERIQATCVR